MANDDPSIGEDTIALELEKKFGVQHSPTTISKVMREARRGGRDGRKSQTWVTFLREGDRDPDPQRVALRLSERGVVSPLCQRATDLRRFGHQVCESSAEPAA